MHDISPVLSGKYDTASYVPPVNNINAIANAGAAADSNTVSSVSDSTSSSYIDPRRYSKFDRSASQVADAPDFSFHDLLDLVNPLQHIPVASSVYRAATGDTINPVSRVAGDILYGGALGAVSAVIGGVSAVADAVSESQTGHDKTGSVLASLFGDDKADTQVAQASAATPPQSVPQTADQSPALASAAAPTSNTITMAPLAPLTAAAPASSATASTAATAPLMQAKAFPLNRQAYGGVMAPPLSMEDQNRIIALSQGSHAMRLGNTIYTSPLMNGPHPMAIAAQPATSTTATTTTPHSNTTAAAPAMITPATVTTNTVNAATAMDNTLATTPAMAPTANNSITAAGQRNPLPQNLIDNMVMMKALGQYKGVAAGPAAPIGASIDLSN